MMNSKKKIHSKISDSEKIQQADYQVHRKNTLSKWWFRIAVALFAATVLYILIFSDFMRITTIHVSGTTTLQSAEVQNVIQQELDQKFVSVIPRNTFPFAVPTMIERKLKETFRRIDTLQITREFPDTLRAVVTEHEAVLVWCRDRDKNDCYVIDRNGVAYEHVDWSSPDIVQNDQVTIIEEKGYEVQLNETILSPEYVDRLMHVRGAMGRASNVLFHEEIIVSSRISKDARLTTGEGWYILVGLAQPLDETERTVHTFFKKTAFEKPRKELEYIDARISEKIFYRFKGDPVESDEEKASDEERSSAETEQKIEE